MQVDKTTLADLSIFHSEEEQSVFSHLNFTHTNGGREYLRMYLGNPLDSLEEVLDIQQTIQHLIRVSDKWPTLISNGTVMVLEKFFESPVNRFSNEPDFLESRIYKIISRSDYLLIRYSVEHAIDFFQGIQKLIHLLQEEKMSRQMSRWVAKMELLLKKPVIQQMLTADKKQLIPQQVLRYGGFVQRGYKQASFELIDVYSRLDAYLSLAIACKRYDFCFPEIVQSDEPYIHAKGLFHILLQTPVSYDVDMSRQNNFLFLTGANMAGKSTFIKAVGLAAYLAHIGMGVPAKQAQMSYLDGLLSNIQVVDNILKGESFFFNEVQRIKKTVEQISDGRKWLILIDELFKGTNQQDAVTCSTAVIEGLRKMNNALFVLSTHLYEIGEDLKKYPNIQFRYFETSIKDDELVFSYQLKEGVSNDRLGYLILRKEGVIDLLGKL